MDRKPQRWSQSKFDYLQEGRGLVCKYCDGPTKFVVVRTIQLKDRIKRVRRCIRCGHTENTSEAWE